MSIALVLLMALVIYQLYNENQKLDKMLLISLILTSIGCALLVLAPGNYVRSAQVASGWVSIAYRGHGQINAWFNWLLLPMVLFVLVTEFKSNFFKNKINQYFIIWVVLSILVMALAPVYPSRATFGSLVLLLILILSGFESNLKISKEKKELVMLMFSIGLMLTLFSSAILFIARSIDIDV